MTTTTQTLTGLSKIRIFHEKSLTGQSNIISPFPNQPRFAQLKNVPINPLQQTIMIAARVKDLTNAQTIIGCIDCEQNNTVTGYSITINTDASITFRTQKYNGIGNNLTVTLPPGSVNTTDWFVATLRYRNNNICGNLNNGADNINSFGSNIDGTNIQNNSLGWILGNQGVISPVTTTSFWKRSLWKKTFWKSSPTAKSPELAVVQDSFWNASLFNERYWNGETGTILVDIPILGQGNPFTGNIGYVIMWASYLGDVDLIQSYNYIKSKMFSRGVLLP